MELAGYKITQTLSEDIETTRLIELSLEDLIDCFSSILENSKNKAIRDHAEMALEKIDLIYDNFTTIVDVLHEQFEKLGIDPDEQLREFVSGSDEEDD